MDGGQPTRDTCAGSSSGLGGLDRHGAGAQKGAELEGVGRFQEIADSALLPRAGPGFKVKLPREN